MQFLLMFSHYICHFNIVHDALCLTPNIDCINHSFKFPLGIIVIPREIQDNADTKFCGANKVYYGHSNSRERFLLW